ncbi:MAG: class C beta-lactamase, partial [Wohlfahrtiimonas sp.]
VSVFALTMLSVADEINEEKIGELVKQNIKPLMASQEVPGMAVAIIYQGSPYYFTFGMADIENQKPITTETIFEIGSVSKTFTGILGGDSIARGKIQLNDSVTSLWPALNRHQWNNISLLNLATYTAGGLPLQIPDSVQNQEDLLKYYNEWQPEWDVGQKRLYGNASLGLFGILIAKSLGVSFEEAMISQVLKPSKLSHTWINVPESEMNNYAFGYSNNKPVRVSQAPLADETYGIKTTIVDLARWAQINMHPTIVDEQFLQQGIALALHRYYQIGNMYQGLGWEMYNLPLNEEIIVKNSDNAEALAPRDAKEITPPIQNIQSSWVHKTGATGGFGAYIAFVPEKDFGIVILANKNYPNIERVKVALKIFNELQLNNDI